MKPLVLASTSSGRRELLARLGLPFITCAPPYPEPACPGLPLPDLARRHALGKAASVALDHPGQVIIGSDQVAAVDGEVLGKPGTREAAIDQLTRMSGRRVEFYTGLAVLQGGRELVAVEPFAVRLRTLSPAEIATYVDVEQPLACAGSFRVEGLGIALFSELRGRDYTSLIGLPLIALCDALRELGLNPLREAATRSGSDA